MKGLYSCPHSNTLSFLHSHSQGLAQWMHHIIKRIIIKLFNKEKRPNIDMVKLSVWTGSLNISGKNGGGQHVFLSWVFSREDFMLSIFSVT